MFCFVFQNPKHQAFQLPNFPLFKGYHYHITTVDQNPAYRLHCEEMPSCQNVANTSSASVSRKAEYEGVLFYLLFVNGPRCVCPPRSPDNLRDVQFISTPFPDDKRVVNCIQSHSPLSICPDSPVQLLDSWEPRGRMWPFSSCSQLSEVPLSFFYSSVGYFILSPSFSLFPASHHISLSPLNHLHLSILLPYKLILCSVSAFLSFTFIL